MMPDSFARLSEKASFSSSGWPPCFWMGGTSPRSVRLPASIEYCSARSPKFFNDSDSSRAFSQTSWARRWLFSTIARQRTLGP